MYFGIEQRIRRVGMEEQFIKESKKVWKFAADAARITDESFGSEDRKHTSTDVFVAIDRSLGALIDKENGSVPSMPGNERRIAQSCVNVRGGIRVVVSRWNGESSRESRDISLECEVKTVGGESSHGSVDTACFEAKTCREVKQKKKR